MSKREIRSEKERERVRDRERERERESNGALFFLAKF